jgi:hypothetical protein
MRKPIDIDCHKAWSWNKHLKPGGKRMAAKAARRTARRKIREDSP